MIYKENKVKKDGGVYGRYIYVKRKTKVFRFKIGIELEDGEKGLEVLKLKWNK